MCHARFPEDAGYVSRFAGNAKGLGCVSDGSEWFTAWRRGYAGEVLA